MKLLLISIVLLTSASTAISQLENNQFFLLNIFSFLNQYLFENTVNSENGVLNSDILQELFNSSNNTSTPPLIESLQLLTNLYTQLKTFQNVTKIISSLDNQCTLQLDKFINGLLNMDHWALQMFDATAKIQPGILEGNIMQMGHYDECLGIDALANGTRINGKYCTSVFSGKEEPLVDIKNGEEIIRLKFSYGMCVPAACNKTTLEEVGGLLEEALHSPLRFQFFEELCDSTVSPDPFSVWAILSIAFFTTMGIIVIFSTLYDIYADRKEANSSSLLTAFSFYSNGKKLFSTKTSAQSLECLNGMRVISMMWIILCHHMMYSQMLPLVNTYFALQWVEKIESTIVTAGNMAVDTFFLISGLLIVYVHLNHKEKGHNMSISMFYIHRILRLTPSLAVLVLFYATLYKYIGSGPAWPIVYNYFQVNCENNWWSTLLYLQNYINMPNDNCISHAWYLAVDTQLYFLSPLLLFPLMRWPKRTISGILVLIFLCCACTFEITWQKELRNAFYGITTENMLYLYGATHVRAAPWLLGIILGYVIFQLKNKKIIIHKIVVGVMWLVSLGTLLGIILLHQKLLTISLMETSLFTSLARTMWGLGIGVIIFLCVTGHGGIINTFLSCTAFRILIRVNYSMYLIHMTVIVFLIAQTRTPGYLAVADALYLYCGEFTFTLLISIVWTLTFESPILVLEKLIFEKKKKPTAVQTETLNNNINVTIIDDKLTHGAKLHTVKLPSTGI